MVLEILIIIFVALFIILGFIGIFIPVLPGSPLIFLGTLIYGIYNGFKDIGWKTYLILGILMVVSLFLDHLAISFGAKKFGSTKWGIFGSFLGGIIGFFVFSLVGLIVGAILGAVLFELLAGQDFRKSLKSGAGVIFGFFGGVILKTILALAMIGIFLWKVF